MLAIWIFLSTFFAGLFYYGKKYLEERSSVRRLPPGPQGWPVLGNLLLVMGPDRHERIRRVGEQFGGIFTLTVGIRKTVWLTKYRLFREAVINHSWEFSGRPKETPTPNELHIGITSGGVSEEDKEVRRFSMVTLRNFGFGKTSMQDALLQEASDLIIVFKRKIGTPFNPRNDLCNAAANMISEILLGKKFKQGDEGFRLLNASITEAIKITMKANMEFSFPVLKWFSNTRREMKYHFGLAEVFFQNIITEHISSRIPNEPRDFIDTWLDQEERTSGRTAHSAFLRKNLPNVVAELFIGALETTSTTFQWIFAMLLTHPGVQERIHAELDEVVGKGPVVTLEHRDLLPYTEGVIIETLRKYPTLPFAIPHMCTKNMKIGGHLLTEGTPVTLHLYSIHHDPEVWDYPEEFRPERYITNGKLVIPEHFVAFSAGRRACLGEQLARKELLLFFANIMQTFSILLPAGGEKPSLEKNDGFVMYPPPFDIEVKLR